MGLLLPLIIVAIGAYLYQTYFANKPHETRDEKFNAARHKRQLELDGLLDKINKKGISSLSNDEHRRLDELSGNR